LVRATRSTGCSCLRRTRFRSRPPASIRQIGWWLDGFSSIRAWTRAGVLRLRRTARRDHRRNDQAATVIHSSAPRSHFNGPAPAGNGELRYCIASGDYRPCKRDRNRGGLEQQYETRRAPAAGFYASPKCRLAYKGSGIRSPAAIEDTSCYHSRQHIQTRAATTHFRYPTRAPDETIDPAACKGICCGDGVKVRLMSGTCKTEASPATGYFRIRGARLFLRRELNPHAIVGLGLTSRTFVLGFPGLGEGPLRAATLGLRNPRTTPPGCSGRWNMMFQNGTSS